MDNPPSPEDLKFTLYDKEDYDYVMSMELYDVRGLWTLHVHHNKGYLGSNETDIFQSEGCCVNT
jgi:hypothetical protein